MRPRAAAFLVCPHCGGPLTLDARARDRDEVAEGQLDCAPVHFLGHDHRGRAVAGYSARDEFECGFRTAELTQVSIGRHHRNSWRGTAMQPRARLPSRLDVGSA